MILKVLIPFEMCVYYTLNQKTFASSKFHESALYLIGRKIHD
jgi:hypothetical protein